MPRSLHYLLMIFGVFVLMGHACPIEHSHDDDDAAGDDDDDDDVSANDDDAADDDDSVVVEPITISGSVLAVDRETGVILSDEEFGDRATVIVIYVLPDPSDLSVVSAKVILEGPGDWELEIAGDAGPQHVLAIADFDRDYIIGPRDVLREYAFNPVTVNGGDLEGIDIILDVGTHSGGGPAPDRLPIDGEIELVNLPEGNVVVATYDTDWWGPIGPRTHLEGSGPFVHEVYVSPEVINLLGYHDTDVNGIFEPSDQVGGALANPVNTALPISGSLLIQIPSLDEVQYPQPTPYVAVTGTVEYEAFTTGDVLVYTSEGGPQGTVLFHQRLAAPGPFALRAPANTDGVVVWAVLDEDGDGLYDFVTDPHDIQSPIDIGTSAVTGIDLVLSVPPGFGAVSGTVNFAPGAEPGDILYIALDNESGEPTHLMVEPNPVFPYEYTLFGVPAGLVSIGSYLDIGGDGGEGPGPGDAVGASAGPATVLDGQTTTGVDVTLNIP